MNRLGLILAMVWLGVLTFAYYWHDPEPPPVQAQPSYVERRLWLRLEDPKDGLARGDRYRVYECKEVAR